MKISADFRNAALRHNILIREVTEAEKAPKVLRKAASVELANYGFLVEPKALKGASTDELTAIIASARSVSGSDHQMNPIYRNFPQGVKDTDSLTLLVDQLVYYISGGSLVPNIAVEPRPGLALEDMLHSARTVRVATATEAAGELVRELTTAPIAMSIDDRTLLERSVEIARPSLAEVADLFGAASNFENAQALVLAAFTMSTETASQFIIALAPKARTVDALLRLVLAVSTEAVPGHEDDAQQAVQNLQDAKAYAVRYNSMSRGARKAIMSRLGELSNGFYADLLVARENMWRRAMRSIHPFSLPLSGGALRAANIIHGNVDYRTLNSLVEDAIATGDVVKTIDLLVENRPSALLRRLVEILRKVDTNEKADALADAVVKVGAKAPMTTLISSYNGVLVANDDNARVTRVAGQKNVMRTAGAKVSDKHLARVADALKVAMVMKLADAPAPVGVVGTNDKAPVALVRRDAATSDRQLDRGQSIPVDGEGGTVRVFCFWKNTVGGHSDLDASATLLDKDFNAIATAGWNTWGGARGWATYSGDKFAQGGEESAEFIDVDLEKTKKAYPGAAWVVLSVHVYAGPTMNRMDVLTGAMMRKKPNSGEIFDARTVVAAAAPVSDSTQVVPLAYNIETHEMVWIDSSSGSSSYGGSALRDGSIGSVVRDEIARPRLTNGELAQLWASAHGAETSDAPVDKAAITALLG